MNMNISIAMTLRIGIILGLILISIGLLMEEGNPFLYYGLLILISSPFLAIITALIGLVHEKDWFWAAIAGVVVLIVSCGAVVAIMF